MPHETLNEILLLLAIAVVAIWALKRFQLPPLLGYLAIGMLLGPYGLEVIYTSDTLNLFAEVGIVFLLYMVGLEFSIPQLLAMRNTVIKLGVMQLVISSLTGGVLIWSWGLDWQIAWVMGGTLALSSTAIVLRQLGEQLEMQETHGQLSIAILLFQDLAVIPLLVIVPILSSETDVVMLPILWATAKGILAFTVMYLAGHFFLRPFFYLIAAQKSAELFTLATLLVALTAAWFTHKLGLSLALGAFLAGIMLSETEYRQQIEIDIRPFRDVLMGIFFIGVGTQFDITILWEQWFWVSIITCGLIVGKGVVIVMLTRAVGYPTDVAIRTGITLGQGGEFGFVVILVALQNGLLQTHESQPIIASIILSMLITSLLIRYNEKISRFFLSSTSTMDNDKKMIKQLDDTCQQMSNHIVICGFGRVGQNLALFLRELQIEYIAIDPDHSLVKQAWEGGENVFYGDSTHPQLMAKVGLSSARAIVITFNNDLVTEHMVSTIRQLEVNIPIIVRSHGDGHMEALFNAGASEVVPESFEVSMILAKHVLQCSGMSAEKAMLKVHGARSHEYRRLRGIFRGQDSRTLQDATLFQLHTLIIVPGSFADGKRLSELELQDLSVSVTSLRKGREKIDYPSNEHQLQQSDAVVLQGTMDALQAARTYLMTGNKRPTSATIRQKKQLDGAE